MNKKGSVVLLAILLALAVSVATGSILLSSDNAITGAVIGGGGPLESAISTCNVSISESIINIGSDYECTGEYGFIINTDDIVLDCQDHVISCTGASCSSLAGIYIEDHTNVTIQNCNIQNFGDGVLINSNSTDNKIYQNIFVNNSDGVGIYESFSNNLTLNSIYNSTMCGINTSGMSNIGNTATYNNIWNNRIYNNSVDTGACSDLTSHNNWNLAKNCTSANIIGGHCLGGNFWSGYNGIDITGDGLGDTSKPYKAGKILAANPIGDNNPLVDPCNNPGTICGDVTCPARTLSGSGDGIAITCSNSHLICNGTTLFANETESDYVDSMRGIEIIGVDNVIIEGCNIYNFTHGVYIKNANNITVRDSTIHDNNDNGIYVGSYTTNASFVNNTLTNSLSTLQDRGITFTSANPSANGGGNNVVVNSTISEHTDSGVYLGASSDSNTISGNVITNNAKAGIFVNSSASLTMRNNSLVNGQYGAYFLDSLTVASFGTITAGTHNMFRNNTISGLYFNESTVSTPITGKFFDNLAGLTVARASPSIGRSDYINNTWGILLGTTTNVQIDYVNLSNNVNGLLLLNSNYTTLGSNQITIVNNSVDGISLFNSHNNNFSYDSFNDFKVRDNGVRNINLTNSNDNTFAGLIIIGSPTGILLDNSNNNSIYNNNFSNTVDANDSSSTNTWSITPKLANSTIRGTNIVSGAYLGGNYWSNYSGLDSDSDGIGDTGTLPWNSSASIGVGGDSYPLVKSSVTCGTYLTESITLTQNLTVNGTCFTVGADDITINLAGFSITGDGSLYGISLNSKDNIIIHNGLIKNFSSGVYAKDSNNLLINISNVNLNSIGVYLENTNNGNLLNNSLFNNSNGVILNSSNNNTFVRNNISLNTLGIYSVSSSNNSIYDNYFINTQNALESSSSNTWNTTYAVATSIIQGTNIGGNYWSNYTGKDIGSGDAPYNLIGDGIGDSQIPYSTGISGDYLPLTNDQSSLSVCQQVSTDVILTADVQCSSSNGIVIAANDVTLNCNGYNINGTGIGAGVYMNGRSNVLIKGCNITNFYYGVQVENSNLIQIVQNNDLRLNDFYGVYIYNSDDVTVANNKIINDNNGIYMINSERTNISYNTIDLHKKFYGVYAFNSPDSDIRYNNFTNNYHGIYLVNGDGTTAIGNVVNGSDVYSTFLHSTTDNSNFRNNVLSFGTEGVLVKENSNSNNFSHNIIRHNSDYGVRVLDSSSNTFSNNTILNNSGTYNIYLLNNTGSLFDDNNLNSSSQIYVVNSSLVSFSNNLINSTDSVTFSLNTSTYSTLQNNTINKKLDIINSIYSTVTSNTLQGLVEVLSSDSLTFILNNVSKNTTITTSNNLNVSNNTMKRTNIVTSSGSKISSNSITFAQVEALRLESVTSSTINGNSLFNTSFGISLVSSTSNTISRNWIKDNALGLNSLSSNTNDIFNNYFKNTQNIVDTNSNNWNTSYSCSTPNIVGGPCIGGNFYSDYSGLDNGANSRPQGDGVGDEPDNYTISSNLDELPLVLYAARQYLAPVDSFTLALNATGNLSGEFYNQIVVPNQVQSITYQNTTSQEVYYVFTGLFNESDVDASEFEIRLDTNYTFVDRRNVTGLMSDYSARLYHDNLLNGGIFACPSITDPAEINVSCPGRDNYTSFPSSSMFTVSVTNEYYLIEGITFDSIGFGIETTNPCGANIYHDVTFTSDVNCSGGSALNISSSDIIIDFNGYTLSGNGSGVGVNISNFNNVTLVNATITNFSIGVYVDPAIDIVINQSSILNNAIGIKFDSIMNSTITSNIIANNTLGILFVNSTNNTVYNNNFNNTNNSREDRINYWNITLVSGTNIVGGTLIGGNFWDDYSGLDTDYNGIGNTLVPYTNGNNLSVGDELVLVALRSLSCSTISGNITLNESLNVNGSCFVVNENLTTVNCDGYSIIGNNTGSAFVVNGKGNVTLQNCVVQNFTIGINMTSSRDNTVWNISFTNMSTSFMLTSSYDNNFSHNTILNTAGVGFNLSSSANNTIYDNSVNTSINAISLLSNNWNISYVCSANTTNIVGGNCTGGNFWSNYSGLDNGNGSSPYNVTPWNISSDNVGDTLIPFNSSNNITGGDFHPLKRVVVVVTSSSSTPATSSSGGGGGGGGGGGSGGGSAIATTSSSCTQEWSCSDWTTCINGLQSRTCNDLNNCESLFSSGSVDNVIYAGQPSLTNSCGVEPAPPVKLEQPTPVSPPKEPITPVQTFALSSVGLLALFGGMVLVVESRPVHKIRRKLRKAESLLPVGSMESLKGEYKGVYSLYLKLSEDHKEKYYTKVNNLRTTIEEQLRAEKLVASLLSRSDVGSLSDQKRRYMKIYKEYQNLAPRSQEKYYPMIVSLREKLDKGR